ncbi:unnamed protein product [Mycena citricolor]|uniref:Uncharacterized protein n=1 Tax=Mycena citricolor TaxID=2018698 RepID=A0AAD2H147_9AGAR|nr:unnamed protein product [Mycena citricolor]
MDTEVINNTRRRRKTVHLYNTMHLRLSLSGATAEGRARDRTRDASGVGCRGRPVQFSLSLTRTIYNKGEESGCAT